MPDQKKLNLTLQAIAQTFNLAAEYPFILDIIRTTPEKDIRHFLAAVSDKEIAAYLTCFKDLQEFEWCRVIKAVMQERNIQY